MANQNDTRFKSPSDLREALHNAMKAVADGSMSPDEADELVAIAERTNKDVVAEFSNLKNIIKAAKAKRTRKATQGTRTSRARVFTDTWLRGKQPFTAPEWSDQPSPGLRIRTVKETGRITFFYRFKLNDKIRKNYHRRLSRHQLAGSPQ